MKTTPLHQAHVDAQARMVEFAGYDMPVLYTSILDEVRAVRHSAGLFDVSHMARFEIRGEARRAFLSRVFTRNLHALREGQVAYGLILRDDGTTIDDALVSVDRDGIAMCANAGNHERVRAWLDVHAHGFAITIDDRTAATAMLALQGPGAHRALQPLCDADLGTIKRYRFLRARVHSVLAVISRTGYTGEDGFELTLPADAAEGVWRALLGSRTAPVLAVGLGARDTLRLEAGMPLYGHEIDDSTTPVEANLVFAVDWDHEFLGREALLAKQAALASSDRARQLVGFVTESRRVPRLGHAVLLGEERLGEVRSGTFSPTLEKNIGTAYVERRAMTNGQALAYEVSGKPQPLTIVPMPFVRPRTPKTSIT
ncbi:MAG: glycine cleavage system aminomethyltransferase GcvT [Planctomycetota bacterium]